MRKMFHLIGLAVTVMLFCSGPLLAEDKGPAPFYGNAIAAGLGAALTMIGAGYGMGKIGAAAMESIARQPEAADSVRGSMIVIAALLEGVTFFSLIVCIVLVVKA